MSEDGKSITYDCKELEGVIAEALRIHDVSGVFCDCIEEYDLHRPLGGTTEYCTHCGFKAK